MQVVFKAPEELFLKLWFCVRFVALSFPWLASPSHIFLFCFICIFYSFLLFFQPFPFVASFNSFVVSLRILFFCFFRFLLFFILFYLLISLYNFFFFARHICSKFLHTLLLLFVYLLFLLLFASFFSAPYAPFQLLCFYILRKNKFAFKNV